MKNLFATLILSTLTLFGSVAVADPTGGTFTDRDVLRVGAATRYSFMLNSNEVSAVRVAGEGDGDIDCFLYDDNGNLVASQVDTIDGCYLVVTPRWTGTFRLIAKNNGAESSVYSLRVW